MKLYHTLGYRSGQEELQKYILRLWWYAKWSFAVIGILTCLVVALYLSVKWYESVCHEMSLGVGQEELNRLLGNYSKSVKVVNAAYFSGDGPRYHWYLASVEPKHLEALKANIIQEWAAQPNSIIEDRDELIPWLAGSPKDPSWWKPYSGDVLALQDASLNLGSGSRLTFTQVWLMFSPEKSEIFIFEVVNWRGRECISEPWSVP